MGIYDSCAGTKWVLFGTIFRRGSEHARKLTASHKMQWFMIKLVFPRFRARLRGASCEVEISGMVRPYQYL